MCYVPTSLFFEYGSDAADKATELMGLGGAAQHVTYSWFTDALARDMQQLLDDVIADEKVSRSDMVDHWVWYMTDNAPQIDYSPYEMYELMHEMLGVQPRTRKDVVRDNMAKLRSVQNLHDALVSKARDMGLLDEVFGVQS